MRLNFNNVSFFVCFRASFGTLDRIDFMFEKGKMYGIVGPPGGRKIDHLEP